MMFDKESYYRYSKTLENFSMIKLGVIVIVCAILGYFGGQYLLKNEIAGLVIGIVVAMVTQYITYIKEQIQVEEMRMMLEIHDSLTKKEN